MTKTNIIYHGDAYDILTKLPDECINTCITSPPYYGLRDYQVDGQIGLEQTLEDYIKKLIRIFNEVKRVLRKDGTLWLNLGDTYYNYRPCKKSYTKQTIANNNQDLPNNCYKRNNKLEGLKEKDLIGIPWSIAFDLRGDGWYLRQDIIWNKKNCMPESVKDRCTKNHEYIFLLSKNKNYYFDYKAIQEKANPDSSYRNRDITKLNNTPGRTRMKGLKTNHYDKRNKRSVWDVNLCPFKDSHFAVFPEKLIKPCILAGCPENGIILDPFFGSGTTGVVAKKNYRKFIGIELNKKFVEMAKKRINNTVVSKKIW